MLSKADAREWLVDRAGSGAAVVVFDPPYAVGTPVRALAVAAIEAHDKGWC